MNCKCSTLISISSLDLTVSQCNSQLICIHLCKWGTKKNSSHRTNLWSECEINNKLMKNHTILITLSGVDLRCRKRCEIMLELLSVWECFGWQRMANKMTLNKKIEKILCSLKQSHSTCTDFQSRIQIILTEHWGKIVVLINFERHKSDNRDKIRHWAVMKPIPFRHKLYASLVLDSLRLGTGFHLDYPI